MPVFTVVVCTVCACRPGNMRHVVLLLQLNQSINIKHQCFLVLLRKFFLMRSSYFTKKWDSFAVTLSFSHTLQSDSNVTIYNKFTLYWVHIASNSTNSSKPDTGLLFGLVHCTYALTGCQRDIICTKIVQTIATQDGGRIHWSPPMASWLIFLTAYRFWARDKRMRIGLWQEEGLVTLACMPALESHYMAFYPLIVRVQSNLCWHDVCNVTDKTQRHSHLIDSVIASQHKIKQRTDLCKEEILAAWAS